MSLQPVPAVPGLWRAPQWKPGQPGVYALVVGISRYRHLADGPDPAPDPQGLGQLVSSAATAAAVFRWLADGYRRQDLPVVWCRLLLAPTDDERTALDADGLTHWAEPTYAALQQAVTQWTGLVPVETLAARASRSLFFFSGHGVQANWQPLLLPSDYLDPHAGLQPQYQHCVSALELFKWMCEHPAAEHLALLDACRNEFSPLASMGATALGLFPAIPPGPRVRVRADLLTATAPSRVAYQIPGQALTVFGQALLEAVRGTGHPGAATLPFRDLFDYVEPRVNLLLRAAGTTVEQSVTPTSAGDNRMVVTELAAGPPAAGASAGGASAGAIPPDGLPRRTRGAHSPAAPLPPAAAPAVSPVPRGTQAAALTRPVRQHAAASLWQATADIGLGTLRSDGALAHHLFGHEYTSALWQHGLQLHGLIDGRRRDDGLTLLGVARDAEGHLLHVDIHLPAVAGGVLLRFDDPGLVQRGCLAVALPTDEDGQVPVRLTLMLARATRDAGGPPKLQSLTARLGPSPPGPAHNPHYAYLWALSQRARLSSLVDAAEAADPARLRAAVADKVTSPTAAVAATLLLARAGRLDRVGDWPHTLMQRQDRNPDAAVLWAAALQQRAAGVPTDAAAVPPTMAADEPAPGLPAQARQALLRLNGLGAPFFADSARLAQRLVQQALQADLAQKEAAALQQLAHALQRLFELTLPGGDFIVLPGQPRPPWLPGNGPLTADEMRRLLRGPLP